MKRHQIAGIDLGGTQLRGAFVIDGQIHAYQAQKILANESAENVFGQLTAFIDKFQKQGLDGLGIGLPGLVEKSSGLVHDVVNIPAWEELPLQEMLENKYKIPVAVENDSNCFAWGEFIYGKGRGAEHMLGITIGTGLGTGIIIHKKLYSGISGGAGEFGMAPYLDHTLEYYASGQFFQNIYGVDGEIVFERAMNDDKDAIEMYEEMGKHLGIGLRSMLYALDIDLIVLGGSVSKAYDFFAPAMWKEVKLFAYRKTLQRLKIVVSELENSAILGAASLVEF